MYYPEEISKALFDLAGIEPDALNFETVEDAIYNIKNSNNLEYRVLYRLLERVTKAAEERKEN